MATISAPQYLLLEAFHRTSAEYGDVRLSEVAADSRNDALNAVHLRAGTLAALLTKGYLMITARPRSANPAYRLTELGQRIMGDQPELYQNELALAWDIYMSTLRDGASNRAIGPARNKLGRAIRKMYPHINASRVVSFATLMNDKSLEQVARMVYRGTL